MWLNEEYTVLKMTFLLLFFFVEMTHLVVRSVPDDFDIHFFPPPTCQHQIESEFKLCADYIFSLEQESKLGRSRYSVRPCLDCKSGISSPFYLPPLVYLEYFAYFVLESVLALACVFRLCRLTARVRMRASCEVYIVDSNRSILEGRPVHIDVIPWGAEERSIPTDAASAACADGAAVV